MTKKLSAELHELAVFTLLVAIGTLGRWFQPEWSFTPIAAVSFFAGYYFQRWPIAAMVPLASMGFSDLLLPAYDSVPVLIATYLVMLAPVALGRMQQQPAGSRLASMVRWTVCGILPATLFFLTTNFAVWAFKSTYEKSLTGLGECYVAAIPFYRWMLAGDLFYLALIMGCFALACYPLFDRVGSAPAKEHK